MNLTGKARQSFDSALARNNLRSTRQREHVFGVLLSKRDHPTADEVYARAKSEMPNISLATVYNCLDTLVDCDLIKRLSYEREPSRFCPNQGDHAHFLDETTGRVFDIDLTPDAISQLRALLPEGFEACKVKLSFSGRVHAHATDTKGKNGHLSPTRNY